MRRLAHSVLGVTWSFFFATCSGRQTKTSSVCSLQYQADSQLNVMGAKGAMLDFLSQCKRLVEAKQSSAIFIVLRRKIAGRIVSNMKLQDNVGAGVRLITSSTRPSPSTLVLQKAIADSLIGARQ